jgi:transcriptional regulator GlxA family with amidase domain
MFKDSIGTTPIDYINGVRVNHALRLLTMTDTPVNEIAEKTGFSNPNYFHKIFKSYMQTSPLAYRKSAIK